MVLPLLALPSKAVAIQWIAPIQVGDPAVGLPGDPPLDAFWFMGWSDEGALFFTGMVGGWNNAQSGLWRWTPEAGIEFVFAAEPEALVPTLANDGVPRMNRAGEMLTMTSRYDPDADCAGSQTGWMFGGETRLAVLDSAGAVMASIETGDFIPGDPQGRRIAWFDHAGLAAIGPPPQLSESGHALFRAVLTDANCSLDDAAPVGILRLAPSGEVDVVAVEEESAPGAPDGFRFERLQMGLLSEAGDTSFWATIRSGDETDTALYLWTGSDGLSRVDIPLLGSSLSLFLFSASIFSDGGLIYGAMSYPDGDDAWFSRAPGQAAVRLIGEGDPLPGFADSCVVSLAASRALWFLDERASSSSGIAFTVALEGPNGSSCPNAWAVLTAEPSGEIRVRALEGADLAWAPGESFCPNAPRVLEYDDDGRILIEAHLQGITGAGCGERGFYVLEPDESGRFLFRPQLSGLAPWAFSRDFSRAAYGDLQTGEFHVVLIPEPGGLLVATSTLGLVAVLRATRVTTAKRRDHL